MGEADHRPGAAGVLAAVHATATGIQGPAAGVKTMGIAGVHKNVSDDVILAGADAAEQLPVRALIAGRKDVTVGGAEIHLFDVVRIRSEGNNRAAWRANLPPRLCRQTHRRGHRDCHCAKPFSIHNAIFSREQIRAQQFLVYARIEKFAPVLKTRLRASRA